MKPKPMVVLWPRCSGVSSRPCQRRRIGLYSFKAAFANEGEESHRVHEPNGVAVASNGNMYVADTKNSRVDVFTSSGGYVTQFGKEGKGNGEFKHPEGVAVASNGNVYVADTGNNRVQEFEGNGTYVRQFGTEGSFTGLWPEIYANPYIP